MIDERNFHRKRARKHYLSSQEKNNWLVDIWGCPSPMFVYPENH
jgi:hypothetical protein